MRLQVGYWSSRRRCNNNNSSSSSSMPPTPNSNTKRSKISSVLCNLRWVVGGPGAGVSAGLGGAPMNTGGPSTGIGGMSGGLGQLGIAGGSNGLGVGEFSNGGGLGLGDLPVTGASFGVLGAGMGLDGSGGLGAGGGGGVGMGGMFSGPTGDVTIGYVPIVHARSCIAAVTTRHAAHLHELPHVITLIFPTIFALCCGPRSQF